MNKVFIWGAGDFATNAFEAIDVEKCHFCGFIDINEDKQGTLWNGKYPIVSPEEAVNEDGDYYLISVFSSGPIISYALRLGIERDRLIRFWEDSLQFDFVSQLFLLKQENIMLRRMLDNAPYEYGVKPIPRFMSNEEMFNQIREERKSLTRFGDGEFEMIRGNKRPWFQNPNARMADRLCEILSSRDEQVVVAIADDFGSLDKFTEKAANSIREYMTKETREAVMKFLPLDRIYGDAYITRSYYMYKDKTYIQRIISVFKSIFENRKILLVENAYCRIGIGNDLFSTARRVRRIIGPSKNAFDIYDEILAIVKKNVEEDELVLVSLGPTATVLAYDLGVQGIQTLDIGQLDTEYEWYLRGATDREEIPGKSVAELSWWHEPEMIAQKDVYDKQVVCFVGE